jgi:glycosyltransferase involved in cell wall biosynthesis
MLKVIFYDEAIAMGGSLMVLSHLFKEFDRSRVRPMLITSMERADLEGLFDPADVIWAKRPRLNYVTRMQWGGAARSSWLLEKLFAYAHTIAEVFTNSGVRIQLLILLLKIKPDVIHINNGSLPFLLARLLNIPFVFHLHAIQEREGGWIKRLIFQSSAYIAISKVVKDSAIAAGYDPQKVVTIPNPAPRIVFDKTQAEMRRILALPESKKVITHVGRLVPWKGQLEFLKAVALVREQVPDICVCIVGGGGEGLAGAYEAQLKAYVANNGLESVVRFVGHVSQPVSYMYASDVVVHSSIEPEPFGLVITEAMVAGAAVVASDFGAPPELIEPGFDGLLIDPHDPVAFSKSLINLIVNDEFRKALAGHALHKVQEHYQAKEIAQSLTSLYERL